MLLSRWTKFGDRYLNIFVHKKTFAVLFIDTTIVISSTEDIYMFIVTTIKILSTVAKIRGEHKPVTRPKPAQTGCYSGESVGFEWLSDLKFYNNRVSAS
jgi:hypothetical protein